MSEMKRDQDSSRFDTDPLQVISKDFLTAKEVEEFFNEKINLGRTEEDDDEEDAVLNPEKDPYANVDSVPDEKQVDAKSMLSCDEDNVVKADVGNGSAHIAGNMKKDITCISLSSLNGTQFVDEEPANSIENKVEETADRSCNDKGTNRLDDDNGPNKEDRGDAKSPKKFNLTKEHKWKGVAVVSLIFGIGCLFVARTISNSRRYSQPSKW